MSIFSSFWQFLSVARLPRVAAGFTDNSVVVVEVKKRRNQLAVERMSSAVLPKALVNPDFSAPNIADPAALANLLKQVSERAGLKREGRWSISLPEGVARSLIVPFDNKPETREELDQMISWKIERLVSVDPTRLRLVRQQLTGGTQPRYLVTAVEESVISEYESVFNLLGWQAGMIMPRHMCEASWLAQGDDQFGEKLLISFNYWGFVAVALHGNQPVMVRPIPCSLDERENELFRFAVYYRDRELKASDAPLRILTVGDEHEVELTQRTFADALSDLSFNMLSPAQLGLAIPDGSSGGFGQLAAPAGLAALAYR